MWQRFKFLVARVNGKKLPFYVILAGIVIFLLVPTGDFTDLITFPIIGILGLKISIIISLIALIILICNGKVRRLFKSPTRNETERICHKISKTKSDFSKCVKYNAWVSNNPKGIWAWPMDWQRWWYIWGKLLWWYKFYRGIIYATMLKVWNEK